jgi:hypothetical protein
MRKKDERKEGIRCSRTLPSPFVIYSVRDGKDRIKWLLYPSLSEFKMACKKCRFRKRVAGNGSSCTIGDPDFRLKFYGIVDKRTWVASVPAALALRNPSLYQEAVEFVEGRARSPRARASSGTVGTDTSREVRTRLELAPGKTGGFAASGVKPIVLAKSNKSPDL